MEERQSATLPPDPEADFNAHTLRATRLRRTLPLRCFVSTSMDTWLSSRCRNLVSKLPLLLSLHLMADK